MVLQIESTLYTGDGGGGGRKQMYNDYMQLHGYIVEPLATKLHQLGSIIAQGGSNLLPLVLIKIWL